MNEVELSVPHREFETDRLAVVRVQMRIPHGIDPSPRQVYMGFANDALASVGWPLVTVTVSETIAEQKGGPFVQFIETDARCRRLGFATEIWEALNERYGGKLIGEAGTWAGYLFLKSVGVTLPEADRSYFPP
ncbi:hypothetical protein Mal4_34420 [Maioricimonas rarisocia]|uniref:N-acetyltransferase domain-containing protein n=2 Tax=Maioricimonas rarisocia TaxID=2528026 RepID=A0A517Z9E9_9PLAN|nr:hypothetical protein Mal4_34420 [Maioricimonas rarisocia]